MSPTTPPIEDRLLHRLPGKLTGTHAARGSLILTGVSFARFVGLGTAVALPAGLGMDGYGRYLLAFSLFSFLGVVYDIVPDRLIVAEVSRSIGAEHYGNAKALLLEFATTLLVVGTLAAVAVTAMAPFAGGLISEQIATNLPLVGLLLLALAARKIVAVVLNVHGKFSALAILRGGESAIRLPAVIVAVIVLDAGVRGALVADLIAAVAVTLVASVPAMRSVAYLRYHSRSRHGVLVNVLRTHGKWAIARGVSARATSEWRLWLVTWIIGLEGTAVFGLSRRLLSSMKAVFPMRAVLDALYARAIIRDVERTRLLLLYALKYKLLVSIAMALSGIAIAGPVIERLFPALYPGAVPVLSIMVLLLVAKVPIDVVTPYMAAAQAQRYLFFIFLVELALFGALAPPLLLLFGSAGAAAELVITSSVAGLILLGFARRVDPGLRIPPLAIIKFGADDIANFKRVVGAWKR